MNADQPGQDGANHTPQDLQNQETSLINLYEELTGEDESQARSTFMYVLGDDATSNPQPNN